MISIEDLRIEQAKWEGTRQEFKKDLIKLEAKRQNFLKLFSLEKLESIKIEKYALQKGKVESKDSFCYWLENELKDLGNIHGSTALKFGIYYGITKNDPTFKLRFASKFGNSETEAFESVKSAVISLLKSAETDDLYEIRNNPLSPMFKGKILSTYFPDKYLNIFDDKHLEYFLDKLDLIYGDSDNEISKRQILFDFKNKDAIMSKWTIYEFSKFLYAAFGKPSNKEEAPIELKEYLESKNDYLKIKQVKANFINLEINQRNIGYETKGLKLLGKTIDFEKENKINKLLGTRGEEIVFNLEKEYFEGIGKKELAEKIEWVSKSDDSLGYDILSYEEDGKKKYIEVKSTNQSPESNTNFLISSNQYRKAKELENYYFYIVFNAKTSSPKVWKIKKPLQYENRGLTLAPINYRVIINTKIGGN